MGTAEPRRDQNSHTTGTTAAPQSRATGAEHPDMAGTGRFPAGAEGPDTGGRTQKARVPDDWQHTATPRDTPRKQPIPLPAPNIIKQDPVVFHKSSVGLNEGGQRLSATPLTSPTEPSPGLDIFPWMENLPERLVQRLRWTPKVPSSGPIIVLLYAGKEDPTSLDSCLHANYPHLSSMELFARQQSRAEWSSLEEDPTAGHGPSCATYQNRGLPPRCEGALQRHFGAFHTWTRPPRLNLMMTASSF